VGFDSTPDAVPDGPQVQLIFEGAEDCFDFGELAVGMNAIGLRSE
jgi:hypothetical protein